MFIVTGVDIINMFLCYKFYVMRISPLSRLSRTCYPEPTAKINNNSETSKQFSKFLQKSFGYNKRIRGAGS